MTGPALGRWNQEVGLGEPNGVRLRAHSLTISCLALSRENNFSSGPSFQTISASGLNAALAHYRYLRRKKFLGLWGMLDLVGAEELGWGRECSGPKVHI